MTRVKFAEFEVAEMTEACVQLLAQENPHTRDLGDRICSENRLLTEIDAAGDRPMIADIRLPIETLGITSNNLWGSRRTI